MKRFLTLSFLALGVIVISGCSTVKENTIESKAISVIKEKYSEFKDYPSNNLPPKSISTEEWNDGWYVAFIQEGSGRPIISAKCFFVDAHNNITNNGEYIPALGDDSIQKFSARKCMPISPQGSWPSISNNLPIETSPTCALETCHGLEIQCGSNPADVCTEIYGMGDKCLKYAKCGGQNGKCQQIENSEFTQCKSCVQKCIENNKNDTMKQFECESNCK